jgi:hypothetical protein
MTGVTHWSEFIANCVEMMGSRDLSLGSADKETDKVIAITSLGEKMAGSGQQI